MALQRFRTTHQSSPYPLRPTEAYLSPVPTTLSVSSFRDVNGGPANATSAPFHTREHQTCANTSSGMSGASHYLSVPSVGTTPLDHSLNELKHPCSQNNGANAQPHVHGDVPTSNDQYQSQQIIDPSSFNPALAPPISSPQFTYRPMSSPTTIGGANADHAVAGLRAEVRPGIVNPPPSDTSIETSMAQAPPSYIKTPATTDGKRYRCDCGHRTKNVGDMLRHHESSKHSEPMHFCVCGKRYSRKDGLTRHKKKCPPNNPV